MTEPSAHAAPSRAAVAFIFITVMLDMLALGIIIPVLPKLVEQFENGNTARAAEVIGVFGTSWAVMQFLASPVLGALSDRFGRRPIILLSNLGLGLDYILMALAPTVGWLWVGRIVSGVTSASIGTAFAYVADVTTPEKRARSYGMMGAAFGIGFIVGPALGGVLTSVSPRLPFWVSASFSLANFCYGLFILPESLPHSRRSAFSWMRANPVGSLKLLRAHPQLMRFAAIHFLYNLAHQSLATVFVLYTGYRYGWTPTDVGWALTSVGVSFAIIQAGLVGRLVARFGEWRMLIAGLSFGATGMAIYGIAPTGLVFAAGIPIMSMWGFYGPSAQGLMTRRVGPTEQGKLQGALSSIMGITGIVGPGLFTLTFSGAITTWRLWFLIGAPFLLASALLWGAVVLALLTRAQAQEQDRRALGLDRQRAQVGGL
jgi:DHA1 family tetracycline resistance protein-like MFS transporter